MLFLQSIVSLFYIDAAWTLYEKVRFKSRNMKPFYKVLINILFLLLNFFVIALISIGCFALTYEP